jgi:hypothetical protein
LYVLSVFGVPRLMDPPRLNGLLQVNETRTNGITNQGDFIVEA